MEKKRLQVYEGKGYLVTFDPNVCIHSGVCLRSMPRVFDVSRHDWIELEAAHPDAVMGVVARCPSGALQSVRAGAPRRVQVDPSGMVSVTPQKDGPLRVVGPVLIRRENGAEEQKEQCSLCRCGRTRNAPFCDASHRDGFKSPS